MAKNAEPRNILEERQRQFQRRMSRHWLNANSSGDGHDVTTEDYGSNDGALRRGKLTSITAPATATSNYRLPAVLEEPNRNSSLRGANKNNVAAKFSSAGKFSIYVDNSDNADENIFHIDQAPPIHKKINSKLPTESERKKENTSDAEQWSHRGGLFSSAHEENEVHREVAVHRQRSTAPKFEIFVEEVIDENTDPSKNNLTIKSKKKELPNRSIRERLDDNSTVSFYERKQNI